MGRPWVTVAAVSMAMLLVLIDLYGLVVALPAVGQSLRVSTATLQWTMNGFFLALAAPMLAVGRLGDLIGRRRVLLMGTGCFVVGSAVSGLSVDGAMLIAGRCIQGAGAAMFMTAGMSIVSNAFPPERRGLAFGVLSAVSNIGSAVGPLVGGFITETWSWRWFFFVNVPVGMIAILLTLYAVPETRDTSASGRIDVAGFVLATLGFVALVLGIQLGDDLHWRSPLIALPLLLGVVLLLVFARVELRAREPLVDLRLFATRNVLATSGVAFFGNFAFGAGFFFPTLYLQNVLHLTPVETGLVFLAYSLAFVGGSPVAGALAPRIGDRAAMATGMVLLGLSFVCFALPGPDAGVWVVGLGLAVSGLGQAFAYNISTSAGMSAIPNDKAGAASGGQNAVRQLGSVFGIALTGALFAVLEKDRLNVLLFGGHDGVSAADRPELKGLLSGSTLAETHLAAMVPQAAAQMRTVVADAFLSGLRSSMLLCLGICVLGVVAALFYRNVVAAK